MLDVFCIKQRMAETTVLDDHMTSGYPVYVGDGGPGLVCAGDLDRLAARVVCASTTGTFLYNMSTADSATAPGGASGVFYRGSVECTGEEADFAECSVSLQTISQCPNGLVQMLTCTSCKSTPSPSLYIHILLHEQSTWVLTSIGGIYTGAQS